MSDVKLEPFDKPFAASITPPGSKSLTNRALVLAALSGGECVLSNALIADDTTLMCEGLRRFGFDIALDANTAMVRGRNGKPKSGEIECGNSGTTMRFLAALSVVVEGEWTLRGSDRGSQRPIGQLVEMLRKLGASMEYLGEAGFPPLRVIGGELPGGLVSAPSSAASSQFLSALLMITPFARDEVAIDLARGQTSWPYVVMTMRLMDEFGITPELVRDTDTGEPVKIHIPQGKYQTTNYTIEPDATAASYFLAAAAIQPGAKVTIQGLGKLSLQGDVGFADVLHRMGAGLIFGRDFLTITGVETLEGIDINLSHMPDTAQTLAAVALFARGRTRISGLRTLRVKETDRLAALHTELRKFEAEVAIEGDDALVITPPKTLQTPVSIDTYDDHRMAMSFAVAGTKIADVTIRNAECVSKTYPNFFADLESLRAQQT